MDDKLINENLLKEITKPTKYKKISLSTRQKAIIWALKYEYDLTLENIVLYLEKAEGIATNVDKVYRVLKKMSEEVEQGKDVIFPKKTTKSDKNDKKKKEETPQKQEENTTTEKEEENEGCNLDFDLSDKVQYDEQGNITDESMAFIREEFKKFKNFNNQEERKKE
ncbi:MAG: hypothetical protein IE916_00545 [Epsilonproteobacteria bacterium]|nr:hypothetical protein [Campylobacterota bacterium]